MMDHTEAKLNVETSVPNTEVTLVNESRTNKPNTAMLNVKMDPTLIPTTTTQVNTSLKTVHQVMLENKSLYT